MRRNNEQLTTSKGETWSRGKKFAFDVNVKVNGSIIQTRDLIEQTTSLTLGNRLVSTGFQTQLACFR